MKKGSKIALIVLAVFVAILTAAFVCADIIVSRIVQQEVAKSMEAAPGCEAHCGDIHIRLFSGTVSVYDLYFAYKGEPIHAKDTVAPGIKIAVERVDVGRIFYSALLKRRVLVSDLRIKEPEVELWLDEKHPETCFPQMHDEHVDTVNLWMESAKLLDFTIKEADLRLHSVRTKLDLDIEDCTIELHDLAYDSVFHYCDSVYSLELEKAIVMIPDGSMRIQTEDLKHKDQGEFRLGETRIANTMPRKRLGEMVKEPVTWMDMQLESVTLSPLNPIRKALAKDLNLESIQVKVKKMDIFRDERFAPKKPFGMPQEALMAVPMKFKVGSVDASIQKIDIEYASTNINCGKLQLKDIKANVANISNAKNATMRVKGSCPVEEGKATAEMTMTMNKACDFTTKLHCANVDGAFLNSFIRPLVGISFKLQIDTLDTEYAGNSEKATGTFRLLYHGLEVKVHKEDDIPYKIVTRNADSFTTIANTLIPKSNPTAVDIHPRAYQVEWTRDVWKPFPLYMFGPCIDGAKETMLPGLYVHKQVNK